MRIYEQPVGEPTIKLEHELTDELLRDIANRNGDDVDHVLGCLLQGSTIEARLFCYSLVDADLRWQKKMGQK